MTLACALLAAGSLALAAHPEGAPLAHTGGFGEPTCASCHLGADLNQPGGELRLEGVPARYRPGRDYLITVHLTRPGMASAGFQLSARVAAGPAAGEQAGALAAPGPRVQVGTDAGAGVEYAQHTLAGSTLEAPGAALWSVSWRAPACGDAGAGGAVVFHLAANAADDDLSPLGDHIYAASAESVAKRCGS